MYILYKILANPKIATATPDAYDKASKNEAKP